MDIAQDSSSIVKSYKGYFINGFKFHTIDYGQGRKIMNSEVCDKESYYNDYERDYYGMLLEIIELQYYDAGNKIILFKYDWYDIKKKIKVDKHDLVEVRHNSRLSTNEPFVLA